MHAFSGVSSVIDAQTPEVKAARFRVLAEECEALAQLHPGWDSYNAKALDPRSLYAVKCLLFDLVDRGVPSPCIIPCNNGNVQLEWHTGAYDLEVEVVNTQKFNLLWAVSSRDPWTNHVLTSTAFTLVQAEGSIMHLLGIANRVEPTEPCTTSTSVDRPEKIADELQAVFVGALYRNTKTDDFYRLLHLAKHTETGEMMAVYRRAGTQTMPESSESPGANDPGVFVRPLLMFAGRRANGRWYFEVVRVTIPDDTDPLDSQARRMVIKKE